MASKPPITKPARNSRRATQRKEYVEVHVAQSRSDTPMFFRLKRTTRLHNVLAKYQQRKRKRPGTFVLMYRLRTVNPSDTPNSLKLGSNSFLLAAPHSSFGQPNQDFPTIDVRLSQPATQGLDPSEYIEVHIAQNRSDFITVFRLKRTVRLYEVLQKYHDRKQQPRGTYVLLHRLRPISTTETPNSLGLGPYAFLLAAPHASFGLATRDAPAIDIRVSEPADTQVFMYRLCIHARMMTLRRLHEEHTGKPSNSTILLYEQQQITENDTPAQLGMLSGAIQYNVTCIPNPYPREGRA